MTSEAREENGEMTTVLTVATISDITQEAWVAMLNDDGALVPSGDVAPGEGITGYVTITGAWSGLVGLSCSPAAARQAAALMFATDEASLEDVEVTDAIGELVNIVGGNLKSLLPEPTVLSLPSVVADGPIEDHARATPVRQVGFAWGDEPVVVRVWKDS